MDLLDLIREAEHADDPRLEWAHVLMPNMAYVCDGGPLGLTDGGPRGSYQIGVHDWPAITCPICRAPGLREIRRQMHLQSYGFDHQCPPLTEIYPAHRCYLWQSIPEETP